MVILFDALRQELRFALRTLRRAPGFAALAVLTLALGIGATTAIFGVVDGVLLRGLPYRDADQLVVVLESSAKSGNRLPSYPTFRDWQAQGGEGLLEGMVYIRGQTAVLHGERGPERLLGGYVSPGFFPLMGTPPLLGRTLQSDDERPGAPPVAVLAHAFWRQRFGGDPGIVGKTLDLGAGPTTIIGVMPRGFANPPWPTLALWQPIAVIEASDPALARRGVHADSRVVARLRPGVDSARATAALRTVQARLAAEHPVEQGDFTSLAFMSLRDELLGEVRPTLLALGGAVLLVLLLACANVATLLLVRAAGRERELAVRAAIGAGRRRIAGQLLAESLVLATAGGALGVLLATAVVRGVRLLAAERLPRAGELAVDGRVLLFALGASLLTALLAGVVPALWATRPAVLGRLRGGSLGAVGSMRDRRLHGGLVAMQFALALVLLVGAGLLLQSFRRVQQVSLGFTPERLVVGMLRPPEGRYDSPAQAAALYDRVLARVREVPGVQEAAVVNHFPLTGAAVPTPVEVDGRSVDMDGGSQALYRTASEGYLRAMQMRMVRGRWFEAGDMRSPQGFVINETMARRFFAASDPVGRRLTVRRSSQGRADVGQPVTGPVLGVVADVRQFGRDSDAGPEVYVPYTLEVWPWITLVVRTAGGAREIPALRRAVREVDPELAVAGDTMRDGFQPVERLLADSVARRRFAVSLVSASAACALLLAAVGMYGVVAQGVAERTREVGVRMALGATERSIVRMMLVEALVLALAGAALGVAGALGATRLARTLLFQTSAADPATYVAAPLLLTAVALLASWAPVRRAARLDPVRALRLE